MQLFLVFIEDADDYIEMQLDCDHELGHVELVCAAHPGTTATPTPIGFRCDVCDLEESTMRHPFLPGITYTATA